MRHLSLIAVIAMVCTVWTAASASGQMLPSHRYRGSYGGYGYDDTVLALYSLNQSNQANQAMANSLRSQGQQGSRQMSSMEGNIRNTMDAAADQRMQSIAGRQQSGRDWWFQVDQQQMAQRQGQAARYADPMAQPVGFERAANADVPRAAMDIIKWPPALQGPRFAEQRTEIEAPYRRGGAKGLGVPTDDDYRDMIQATDQMKDTLKNMANSLSAEEYLGAEAFLNQLAAEARARLEKTPTTK